MLVLNLFWHSFNRCEHANFANTPSVPQKNNDRNLKEKKLQNVSKHQSPIRYENVQKMHAKRKSIEFSGTLHWTIHPPSPPPPSGTILHWLNSRNVVSSHRSMRFLRQNSMHINLLSIHLLLGPSKMNLNTWFPSWSTRRTQSFCMLISIWMSYIHILTFRNKNDHCVWPEMKWKPTFEFFYQKQDCYSPTAFTPFCISASNGGAM